MNFRPCFVAFIILLAPLAQAAAQTPVLAYAPVPAAPAAKVTASLTLSAVEAAPALVGEQPDITRWIAERIVYPDLALDYGIEGEVVVSYRVAADGTMSEVRVHQSLGYGCDAAVLALFKQLPQWKPGVRQGNAVSVQCYTPVSFRLR